MLSIQSNRCSAWGTSDWYSWCGFRSKDFKEISKYVIQVDLVEFPYAEEDKITPPEQTEGLSLNSNEVRDGEEQQCPNWYII